MLHTACCGSKRKTNYLENYKGGVVILKKEELLDKPRIRYIVEIGIDEFMHSPAIIEKLKSNKTSDILIALSALAQEEEDSNG